MSKAGKLDLNLMQTAGSALAALSSAVVLSTLGATGTLVGAAVGSIVVTVGGTVYSHYLSVSRARMAAARNAAVVRASRSGQVRSKATATATGASVEAVTRTISESPERFPLLAASARGASSGSATPAAATGSVTPDSASPSAPEQRRLIDGYLPGTSPSFRQLLRGLRWKPALAASLGIFVLVMGAIVSMELATGRALSSYTGGSSADGPRTSIALLSSTSDAGGSGSTTDGTKNGTDKSPAGSGDKTGQDGSKSAGDTGSGSTSGTDSDTDAPQPDTSTPEPDAGTPTEPAPEPTPTEPAPQPTVPTPAPSTPPSVHAPATGAAVSGAAANSAS